MNKDLEAIKELLEDFEVSDESELLQRMAKDALTLKCIKCKKERPYELIRFVGGDPVCKHCRE